MPTKLTQGASKEQLLIEKEMNELIVKRNKKNYLMIVLFFSVLGIPFMLFLIKPIREMEKRLRELQNELTDLMIKEASEK
jgi:phage regulator Rha-like protein